ncbi:MAG: hypothetical protein J0L66_03815 [Cytophagales bacterium]|nr:hypothetical protein [Cytophagales bacterium]
MSRIIYFIISVLFISCDLLLTAEHRRYPESAEGYFPVYSTEATTTIAWKAARAIKAPGKIYVYGDYLFINEVSAGIHVYNNLNPAAPEPLGFIEIVGNSEMAIRENVLYANHMGSLVAIELSDFSNPKLLGRVTISQWLYGVPPPPQSYFECVEPGQGLVVGWKKRTLKNPTCYAN